MPANHVESVLANALELYCQWLNRWMEGDKYFPGDHRYTPTQFQIYDPDQGLYGDSRLVAMVPMYDDLYIFHITDGDEGGPTELYVWALRDDEGTVTHICQGFDTNVQDIYDRDGNFANTP